MPVEKPGRNNDCILKFLSIPAHLGNEQLNDKNFRDKTIKSPLWLFKRPKLDKQKEPRTSDLITTLFIKKKLQYVEETNCWRILNY